MLLDEMQSGDVVLVKGARAMGMERLVESLQLARCQGGSSIINTSVVRCQLQPTTDNGQLTNNNQYI